MLQRENVPHFLISYQNFIVMVHQFLRAGNTAVITGAGAGGIGFAVAAKCAALGMRIVLADIDQKALDSAQKELVATGFNPASLLSVQTDVSDYAAMEKLEKEARLFGNGRIDFLVLNAGVQAPTKDWGGKEQIAAWKKTLDVNLFGVLNGTQAFVEGIKDQNSPAGIVITGSKQYVVFHFPKLQPSEFARQATVASHLTIADTNRTC